MKDPSTGDANDPFPFACSAPIYVFLELSDLCSLCVTSISFLKDSLPELERRRARMKKCYAFSRDWKTGRVSEKVGIYADMTTKYPAMQWIPMPTVDERVQQLHKRIPVTHKLCAVVKELRDELQLDMDHQAIALAPSKFGDIFPRLQKTLHAHKLHAFILRMAMHSDPLIDDNLIHSNPLAKENSTTLSQYIGDVLCVTYLINQSNLKLVEGGPTNATFMKELRRQSSDSSCYRSWVHVHSSILRVKQFTDSQRSRLGIPEMQPALSEMIQNDCYINEFFMGSEMTLVFSEFGPLGPTFRGRDTVRLREIQASCLFAFFVTNDTRVISETARTALEWICLVHEEARKARPISVRAPVIRLCAAAAAAGRIN